MRDDDNYKNYMFGYYGRKKPGLSKQQIEILLQIYSVNKKPTTMQRIDIAGKLNVSEDKIKNWFQNKRAKDKKMGNDGPILGFRNGAPAIPHVGWKLFPGCNSLYRRRDTFQ